MAETLKAEAQRDRVDFVLPRIKTTAKPSQPTTEKVNAAKGQELKKFEDVPYEDDITSDEYDEDESEEEEEDDDDVEDELEDDEEVMTQCPDYCRCSGQYAAAMTATYVPNRIII